MGRDLASIVQDQGVQFDSIENQAESSCTNTKQAVQELKKAVDRQKGTRERLCCMLALAIVVLCFVILPHMSMPAVSHSVDPADSVVAEPPKPSSGDSNLPKSGHQLT